MLYVPLTVLLSVFVWSAVLADLLKVFALDLWVVVGWGLLVDFYWSGNGEF